jgi:hypothetical protein
LKKIPTAFMASCPMTGISGVSSNQIIHFVAARNANRLATALETVRLTIGPFIS